MSRPWELCRVCSLISRISFRSRSKAGEIKFFLTSGPAVGDGERLYKCSPGAPAAAGAAAGPCGAVGLPGQRGRAGTRGRARMREGKSCLPCSARPGQAPAGGLSPVRERCPQHPPNPGAGAGADPPGKEGPGGSFPATGANCKRSIKSERGEVINDPFGFKRGLPRLRVSHQERGGRGERLRLGVRRFSKLLLPPRSGTLCRGKSVAVLAPSGSGALMDTGAGAGRALLVREPGPSCSARFLRAVLIRGDR